MKRLWLSVVGVGGVLMLTLLALTFIIPFRANAGEIKNPRLVASASTSAAATNTFPSGTTQLWAVFEVQGQPVSRVEIRTANSSGQLVGDTLQSAGPDRPGVGTWIMRIRPNQVQNVTKFADGSYKSDILFDDQSVTTLNFTVGAGGGSGTATPSASGTPRATGTAPATATPSSGGSSQTVIQGVGPVSLGEVVIPVTDSRFRRSGPEQWWNTANVGYKGGIMYWTYGWGSDIVNAAEWRPILPGGRYELFVWIPRNFAGSTSAPYRVHHANGVTLVHLNQNIYSDEWVSLGTYTFARGNTGYLELTDDTGEDPALRKFLGFDAVRFTPR